MKNRISVVIVSWNAKTFLIDCLSSLLVNQEGTPGDRQIVVVDNASDDGTAEAVCQLFPEITVIRNTNNCGFAVGNNIGISSTDSEYIALVNPDVIVNPNCLARLSAYMDQHPDVGLTGPKVFNPDGTLQQSHWPVPTLRGRLMRALGIGSRGILDGHSASADRDKTVGVLSGCFWMVRRSALGDVGLLDEGFFMYAEDTDWCKRFWDAGWKVVYMPSATAMHYGGGSSANTPVKSYIEMHRANLRYWGKHHGLLGKMGVYLTMLLHQGVRILGGGMLLLTSRSKRESIRPVVRRSLACLYYLCAGVRPQTG